jgi:hypothetical protein
MSAQNYMSTILVFIVPCFVASVLKQVTMSTKICYVGVLHAGRRWYILPDQSGTGASHRRGSWVHVLPGGGSSGSP